MTRSKKVRRVLAYVAAILGIVVLYRFTRPVIFYIPSDCVCSDYPAQVEGFSVMNPFRDRTPERAADRFLDDTRRGRESAFAAPELASKLKSRGTNVSAWKLAYREDTGDSVLLYYKVDASGLKNPPDYGGEGMIEMRRETAGWRAVNFSAIF